MGTLTILGNVTQKNKVLRIDRNSIESECNFNEIHKETKRCFEMSEFANEKSENSLFKRRIKKLKKDVLKLQTTIISANHVFCNSDMFYIHGDRNLGFQLKNGKTF